MDKRLATIFASLAATAALAGGSAAIANAASGSSSATTTTPAPRPEPPTTTTRVDDAQRSARTCRTARGGEAFRPLPRRRLPPRGSSIVNAAPPPGTADAVARPPWASVTAATIERPSPAPPAVRAREESAR